MRAKGRDLSIITYAATVWKALEAAEELEKEDGLSVEVVDLRTLVPLDDEAIVATVRKTNRVLVRARGHADRRHRRRDHGADQRVCFEWLDAPVLRVTAHDMPLPYAPPLEDFVLPQTSRHRARGARGSRRTEGWSRMTRAEEGEHRTTEADGS